MIANIIKRGGTVFDRGFGWRRVGAPSSGIPMQMR